MERTFRENPFFGKLGIPQAIAIVLFSENYTDSQLFYSALVLLAAITASGHPRQT